MNFGYWVVIGFGFVSLAVPTVLSFILHVYEDCSLSAIRGEKMKIAKLKIDKTLLLRSMHLPEGIEITAASSNYLDDCVELTIVHESLRDVQVGTKADIPSVMALMRCSPPVEEKTELEKFLYPGEVS